MAVGVGWGFYTQKLATLVSLPLGGCGGSLEQLMEGPFSQAGRQGGHLSVSVAGSWFSKSRYNLDIKQGGCVLC